MLSTIPYNLSKIPKEERDKEIARAGMIAELDAVSLYEQMAELATNKTLKAVLLDIAKEEKTHIGEFQTVLINLDPEYFSELAEGTKEVKKLS